MLSGGTVFNLLVKFGSWGDGRDSLPASRLLQYTEDSIRERFAPDWKFDFDALTRLPTLFVEETNRDVNQTARVGIITDARLDGKQVVVEYNYEPNMPALSQGILQNFAKDLDIKEFELATTHWAVKKDDLYRFVVKRTNRRRQLPNVFTVPDIETIDPNLMSAMMPFDMKFDKVYEVLKRAGETVGFRCRRADDIWENASIIQDVVALIDRSKVVICDCSGRNPNVFYEIGIAHTLGRDVILITQSESDIPFDLRHLRYVKYLNNSEGLSRLSAQLQAKLADIAGST
jgi:hypothetical protein